MLLCYSNQLTDPTQTVRPGQEHSVALSSRVSLPISAADGDSEDSLAALQFPLVTFQT